MIAVLRENFIMLKLIGRVSVSTTYCMHINVLFRIFIGLTLSHNKAILLLIEFTYILHI